MPRPSIAAAGGRGLVKLRTVLMLIVIMVFLIALKPRGMWTEIKRSWAERERIMRVLFFVVMVYFLYGLYSMYQKGMIPWW